ncbi:MAG: PQQ-dependent sugar dehydrogenase [Planctomycetota bacterium]|nr:PQQ-dependent sugar dehydrogenase [Planctomycetota bacterium]
MNRRAATRLLTVAASAAMLTAVSADTASAQTLDTVRIASGLPLPLYVTHAPGEPYYIYFLQKQGLIRRLDLRTNAITTFIDLNPVVLDVSTVNDERGLLGLAFHPGYEQNGYFFVYYTSTSGTQVVARYQRSIPGVGNPGSATIVLNMADPFSNHNGGWMAFAPNDTQGFLYISTGDGGSGGDPNQAGQNLNTLLGKMLRIDVDGADNTPGNDDDDGVIGSANAPYTNPPTNPFVGITGLDEIWAYGLRNAWRSSFDRATGALYIADVGQSAWEELNFQPANSAGGQNYGWRCYEGNVVFNSTGTCSPLPTNVTFPFHVYPRSAGISVTGGYVYRGCAIPAIQGHYFYADFGFASVWSRSGASANAAPTGAEVNRTTDLSPPIGGGSISSIASFGEDAFGELYIVRHSTSAGEIFRIVPQGNPDLDCNNNNVADCGELALGLVADCNNNSQLDSCEIAGNAGLDCDSNTLLDSCEITSNPALDCDNNQQLDSCQIAADVNADCNANLVLDVCEACTGDANNDGVRNFSDITSVLGAFNTNYGLCILGEGDADHNGIVNFGDVTAVLGAFATNCPN